MLLPLSVLYGLGHLLFVASGARTRTVASGRRRMQVYDQQGAGPGAPVLLLHGLGGNASSFARLLRPLRKVSRRVVVPDLPGHGRSALKAGDPPLRFEELAEAAVALLEDLGEPAVVVGNSLGGALGLHLLLERPDRVLGWVGLAPAGAPLTAHDRDTLRQAFGGGLLAARDLQARLWHRTPLGAWLVLRDFARYWQLPEVEQIVAEVLSTEVSLAVERLRGRKQAALVLWGESDRLLPASSVPFFRAHLGAEAVEIVPRCGHLPQMERPRLTAARIATFLASLPRRNQPAAPIT